jgi:hypothetical protein
MSENNVTPIRSDLDPMPFALAFFAGQALRGTIAQLEVAAKERAAIWTAKLTEQTKVMTAALDDEDITTRTTAKTVAAAFFVARAARKERVELGKEATQEKSAAQKLIERFRAAELEVDSYGDAGNGPAPELFTNVLEGPLPLLSAEAKALIFTSLSGIDARGSFVHPIQADLFTALGLADLAVVDLGIDAEEAVEDEDDEQADEQAPAAAPELY